MDSAGAWLADKGYDPVYGARPLKRVIQRHLQDPLAQLLLGGQLMDGQTVPITSGPDGLVIGIMLLMIPDCPKAALH